MRLLKEIEQRMSPSLFLDKKVEKEKIHAILEAAKLAPSCFNNQPWKYVVVEKQDKTRNALEEALATANDWAKKASHLIVVAGNPEDDCTYNNIEYYLYDIGLSVMSFVIEAEHQGVRTRQMAGWDKKKISRAVNLPEGVNPIVVIALGYEDTDPNTLNKIPIALKEKVLKPKERKDIKEIGFFGEYKND